VAAVDLAEGSAASAGAAGAGAGAGRGGKKSRMAMTRRGLLRVAALAGPPPLTGCSCNTLRRPGKKVEAHGAQVQNQLQRRNDLIPNVVETTKGFAQHEETVYKEIADARSQLLSAKSPEETISAANRQTSALGRLLAVVENYPQLKSNEQFNRL